MGHTATCITKTLKKIDDTAHALVDCNWTCNLVDKILDDIDPDRD